MTIIVISIIIIALGILTYLHSYNMVIGQVVNITELNTLDRMRFTAIQMTILDLESQTPTNMSNDQIASKIFEYYQSNDSINRLTTTQIEDLYRNITQGQEQQQ